MNEKRPVAINNDNIQLINLDENINILSNCALTITILFELNPTMYLYSDVDQCLELIKSILNDSLTHQLSIKEPNEMYPDQYNLLKSMDKQTFAFNLFDQKQKSLRDLTKESASFLWNQMLIFVLKQIPQD